MSSIETLFAGVTDAVNVGVAGFAGPLAARGVRVTQLDWRPPAAGDEVLGLKLAGLVDHPLVEAANHEAVARMLDARALWVDVRTAGEVLPALAEERLLLHAGPPIAWRTCAGRCAPALSAPRCSRAGRRIPRPPRLRSRRRHPLRAPGHHHDAVGPMAGIISALMPVIVVEDPASGKRAYSNLNEGAGRCLRYGALGDDVMARLRWMNDRLGRTSAPRCTRSTSRSTSRRSPPRRCRWATSATVATWPPAACSRA